MAEKDITEKLLEEQNDVFADIINTLVFGGKQVIKEEDLESISALSVYKMAGDLRYQERDVLKAWRRGCIRIAVYGLENQTNVDHDIPLRVISYDGAMYRAQLDEKLPEGGKRYPVITLVLYFGKGRWAGPKNLLGRLSVPKELEDLVSDYRINVFEIGQLSEEKIKQFSSDFQIVADYVIQMKQGGTYKPSEKPMRHLEGVMNLMEALTNDEKYKESIQVLRRIKDEGGEPTMRSAMDEAVRSAMDEAVRTTETRMRSAMDEAVRSAKDEAVKSTETRMRSAMDEAVKSAMDEAVKNTEIRMRSAMDEAVKTTETRMRAEMSEEAEQREQKGRIEACENIAKNMIIQSVYSLDEIHQLTLLSKNRIEELQREVLKS